MTVKSCNEHVIPTGAEGGAEESCRRPMKVMPKTYYVYIMSSYSKTLYVGMTNNLVSRVNQHKEGRIAGFTQTYKITRLIYFEEFIRVTDTIAREKQIKKWNRAKKVALIATTNPEWKDISEGF